MFWSTISNIGKITGCLAGIATIIAAIIVTLTFRQSKNIWERQLRSGRPFVRILPETKISQLPGKNDFRIGVLLENGGTRPAYDLSFGHCYIEGNLVDEPLHTSIFPSPHPLWPGSKLHWTKDFHSNVGEYAPSLSRACIKV